MTADRPGSRLLPWAIGLLVIGLAIVELAILRARSETTVTRDAFTLIEPGGDGLAGLRELDATSIAALALLWVPVVALLGHRAREMYRGRAHARLARPLIILFACAAVAYAADAVHRERAAQRMRCMAAALPAYPRPVRDAALRRADEHARGFLGGVLWRSDGYARAECERARLLLGR